jgi:UDP-2,4-diacetamido-2,4,6-trideoxy-beta-L-altropyranose hydrolase
VRRCLALAQALQTWAECRLLVDVDGPATALARVRGVACEVVGPELGSLVSAAETMEADAVVVDSYTLNVAALRSLRDRLRLLAVIDDAGEFPVPAHLIINAAPGVRPPATGIEDYLLGTRYALLAPEFAGAPEREWAHTPARVFVTLGATTPAELLGSLAAAVRRAAGAAAIDVVAGPAADQPLLNRVLRPVGGVSVHVAPPDMRALMLAADLAVTAGGVTAFELAATATPMIGITLAGNQRANLLGLADADALLFAGVAEDIRLPAVVEEMSRALARDADRRRTLGEHARLLVDGSGAARVAETIRARIVGAGAPAGTAA